MAGGFLAGAPGLCYDSIMAKKELTEEEKDKIADFIFFTAFLIWVVLLSYMSYGLKTMLDNIDHGENNGRVYQTHPQ